MELFHSPASPFLRKVVMLAIAAGWAGDLSLVSVTGTPLAPGSLPLALNPLGKIPALRLAHGRVLCDSRVICRPLDHHGRRGTPTRPAPPLLRDSPVVEALADGIAATAAPGDLDLRHGPRG